MRFGHKREFYTPEGGTLVDPQGSDAAIYTYDTSGTLYALAFHGRAQKPDWHYRFRSEEQRTRAVETFILGRRGHMEIKQQRQAERQKGTQKDDGF